MKETGNLPEIPTFIKAHPNALVIEGVWRTDITSDAYGYAHVFSDKKQDAIAFAAELDRRWSRCTELEKEVTELRERIAVLEAAQNECK